MLISEEGKFNPPSPDQRKEDENTAQLLSIVCHSPSRAVILATISHQGIQSNTRFRNAVVETQGENPVWEIGESTLRSIVGTFQEVGILDQNRQLTDEGKQATDLSLLIADYCRSHDLNQKKLVGSRQTNISNEENEPIITTAIRLKLLREMAYADGNVNLTTIAQRLGISKTALYYSILELKSAGIIDYSGRELSTFTKGKENTLSQNPIPFRREGKLTQTIWDLFSSGELATGTYTIAQVVKIVKRDESTVGKILDTLYQQGFLDMPTSADGEIYFTDEDQRAIVCGLLEIVDTYTSSPQLQNRARGLYEELMSNPTLAAQYMEASKPSTDTGAAISEILNTHPEGLTARQMLILLQERGFSPALQTVMKLLSEIAVPLGGSRRNQETQYTLRQA